MKDINIAVIGWGFMGRMHTYALRAIPLMYRNLSFRPVLKCLCSAHLENALEAPVDLISDTSSDRAFLAEIAREEVSLYERQRQAGT